MRTQSISRDTAKDTAPGGSIEDTLSSETAINLEQADPLAEADFHMAYGLHDQAADIVKLASEREPARRDLKLKLLEVYFVWGNKDAFLEVARDLGRSRDQGVAGEWDKVVIMGRQIAGDDPLFAGASGGGAAAASGVDLDLDASGMHRIDLELLGEPPTHGGGDADAVDLDLSQALGGDGSSDTGESPTLDPDRIDLLLNDEKPDAGGGTTREMRPAHGGADRRDAGAQARGRRADHRDAVDLDPPGQHGRREARQRAEARRQARGAGCDRGAVARRPRLRDRQARR